MKVYTHIRIAEKEGTVVMIKPCPEEDQRIIIPSMVTTVRRGLVRVPALCLETRGMKLNHREAIAHYEVIPDNTAVVTYVSEKIRLRNFVNIHSIMYDLTYSQ